MSVVLLGMLMMVRFATTPSRWSISFMSLKNGLILAATGAKGVPLVVRRFPYHLFVLVALVVISVFLFRRQRAVRHGRRPRAGTTRHNDGGQWGDVGTPFRWPLLAALVLSAFRPPLECRVTAWRHFRCWQLGCPEPNAYIVDDLNVVASSCSTRFRRFLPRACSARLISPTRSTHGRLTATNLRFYHAMYQFCCSR